MYWHADYFVGFQGESSTEDSEDPDAPGITNEQRMTMENQQPGPDGARSVHRSTQAHYSFTTEPSATTQQHLLDCCLQFLELKADLNMTQRGIDKWLLHYRNAPWVDADLRANLPTNFKALHTALRGFGFPADDLWEYDTCPCSHIYRCACLCCALCD
jgi:hypothetical protein